MVETECVPSTHRLVARNWNFPIGGLPRTAARVASRGATSTPLVCGCCSVVAVVLLMVVLLVTGLCPSCSAGSAGRVVVTDGRAGTLGTPPSPDLPAVRRRRPPPGRSREGARASV